MTRFMIHYYDNKASGYRHHAWAKSALDLRATYEAVGYEIYTITEAPLDLNRISTERDGGYSIIERLQHFAADVRKSEHRNADAAVLLIEREITNCLELEQTLKKLLGTA